MLTRRNLPVIPMLICLLGGFCAAEEVREWTDLKGQKMSAKFLMLTPDQKLVLESEGKTYFIPLDRFSPEDRQYVKSLQDMPETETESPPEKKVEPKPAPKTENLTESRLWTDFQGRQVKAKFLRMHEGRAILMQGSTPRPVSFYTLSQEDQDWLREQLQKRGEEDQILTREGVEFYHPGIHKAMDEALALRPQSDPPPRETSGSDTSANNTASRPPAYMPPTSEPLSPSTAGGSPQRQAQGESTEQQAQRRPLFLPPEEGQPSPGPGEFGDTAPTATTVPTNPEVSSAENIASSTADVTSAQPGVDASSPGFRSRFDRRVSDVQPGYCPNCRKELPQGIGPGDHCPRCRFFLDESVSPGTGSPVEPWYKQYNLAMIGGIAVVAIGALTLLSKKFQG